MSTPQKHRSPSYPAIDLKTAIMRAQQFEKVAKQHPARVEAALKAWGYAPKSSNGLLTIAALRKYELLEYVGSGDAKEARLTQLGRELIFLAEGSGEWTDRMRQAALLPAIHAELWGKYGPELPDDSVMLPYLILERGFSESAGRDALRQFRASVEYAGLAAASATVQDDGLTEPEPIMTTAQIEQSPPPAAPPIQENGTPQRMMRTVQVTYSPTEWALLQAKFPMPEGEWEAFMDVLAGMKRGLVSSE